MGDLRCLCCPTRSKITGFPSEKAAFQRGVCITCRNWLRNKVYRGKETEDSQIKRGLILPAKAKRSIQIRGARYHA